MQEFELVQTEKSFLAQKDNYYLINFKNKNFTPNKIEVTKFFIKEGYTVVSVNVINQYRKLKKRGSKNKSIAIKRPKKYYIQLAPGQSIKSENQE